MTSDRSKSLPWSKYGGYREVAAHPAVYEHERFPLQRLLESARRADVLFRGWPFIFVDQRKERTKVLNDRIETDLDLTQTTGYESFEHWELHQSGAFLHKTLMGEATMPAALRRGKVLDVIETVYHVGEAVGSLWRLYEALGIPDDENITIDFRYLDMEGRIVDVLDPSRGGIFAQPCAAPSIERTKTHSLAEWRSSDAQFAAAVATEILERAGWMPPNTAEIKKVSQEFLATPRFGSGYA